MKKYISYFFLSALLIILVHACSSGNVKVKGSSGAGSSIITGNNSKVINNYISLVNQQEVLENEIEQEERLMDSITALILGLERKFSVFSDKPLTKKESKETKEIINEYSKVLQAGSDRKSRLEERKRLNRILINEAKKTETIKQYLEGDTITLMKNTVLDTTLVNSNSSEEKKPQEPKGLEIDNKIDSLPSLPEPSQGKQKLFNDFSKNTSLSQYSILERIEKYKDSIAIIDRQLEPVQKRLNTIQSFLYSGNTILSSAYAEKLKAEEKQWQDIQSKLTPLIFKYNQEKDFLTYLLERNNKSKLTDPKQRNPVYPKDGKELMEALKSNTRIILTNKEYNISPSVVGRINNQNVVCYEGDCFIENLRNLEITSLGSPVHIYSNIINLPVLKFKNIEGLLLSNLRLGHSGVLTEIEITCGPGGDVIEMNECFNVNINDVSLYGCGVQGLDLFYCGDISMKNSRIYDCTNGAVSMYGSYNILFEDCNISNNFLETRAIFDLSSSKNIYLNNLIVSNNHFKENDYSDWNDTSLFSNYHSYSDIYLENSLVKNNTTKYFSIIPNAFKDNNNTFSENRYLESRFKERRD